MDMEPILQFAVDLAKVHASSRADLIALIALFGAGVLRKALRGHWRFQASLCAIVSSRISLTVKGTIVVCARRKN